MESAIVEDCSFAGNIHYGESFYQEQKIDENTARYYFGGDYKEFRMIDILTLPKSERINIFIDDFQELFAKNGRWIDIEINYDNQLKERVHDENFKYYIHESAELHGERFVIVVNDFTLEDRGFLQY